MKQQRETSQQQLEQVTSRSVYKCSIKLWATWSKCMELVKKIPLLNLTQQFILNNSCLKISKLTCEQCYIEENMPYFIPSIGAAYVEAPGLITRRAIFKRLYPCASPGISSSVLIGRLSSSSAAWDHSCDATGSPSAVSRALKSFPWTPELGDHGVLWYHILHWVDLTHSVMVWRGVSSVQWAPGSSTTDCPGADWRPDSGLGVYPSTHQEAAQAQGVQMRPYAPPRHVRSSWGRTDAWSACDLPFWAVYVHPGDQRSWQIYWLL